MCQKAKVKRDLLLRAGRRTGKHIHACRYRFAGKRAKTGLHTYAGGDDDDERIRPCDEDGPCRYYCTAWQSELDLAAVAPDSEHVLVEDGPELALSGLGIWDAGRRSLGEGEWRRGVRACLVRRWHYCGWLGSMIVVGGEIIETNVEADRAHAIGERSSACAMLRLSACWA